MILVLSESLKADQTVFRSVTVKMMWTVDVSYSLFILGRNLILSTAKRHVTIVPSFKAVLRRMSQI